MSRKWGLPALAFVLALTAGTACAQSSITVGLGNYWPFDEGVGTIAHDVISHQNGTLTNFQFDATDGWRPGGGVAPAATVRNYSIQFDGVDDYIDLGKYSIPTTASISAWVNIRGSNTATNNQPFYILGDETYDYGTVTFVQGDGSVWITDRNAAGNVESLHTAAGIVPADNKWHQIVYLRDDSSPLANPLPTSNIEAIYVDGVLRAKGIMQWMAGNPAAPGAIGMGFPMTGPLPLDPSGAPPISAPVYSNGLIDDVRVYNRLLAASTTTVDQSAGGEIAALYVATTPLPGDANMDGTVDGADLNIVLSNYNQTNVSWLQGDLNSDGVVDGADLNIVLSNYNQSSGVGAAVPEPGTLGMLALGAMGLLAHAWRQRMKRAV